MAVKRSILFLGILLVSFSAFAQEKQADSLRRLPLDMALLHLNNNWLRSQNAAGMQLSNLFPAGKTQLSFNNLQGSLKLAQQAESSRQLNFTSERYLPLGKSIFYGSFSYTDQRDKEIHLSDVMDPYRGTPYVLADSIGGDWKKQLYALTLKVASPKLLNEKLILGIGADLKVATGARQNDPRPLNTSDEIAITPGLTWKLNNNSHIGINGLYGRYKEDISLEVKNTNVSHNLYKLQGVGQYELPATFTVGSSRNYNGIKSGGDLQYEWSRNGVSWLSNAAYRSYEEKVSDGNSVPRKSGTWKQKDYSFASSLNLSNEMWFQQFKIQGQLLEDTGIEFHEYYNTSTKAWQTILEAPFYLAETRQASILYTLLKISEKDVYNWLGEIGVQYLSIDKDYTIPVSFDTMERADFTLKFGKNVFAGKNSNLQTSLKLGYSVSLSDALQFIPVTADRTLIAREVLYPDHAYLSSNRMMANWEVQYNFSMAKVKNTRFFIGSIFNIITSASENALYPATSGNRSNFKLSLGAYY